ncbi:hypothetical protein ABBQ38_008290 [Trebouxia sp. C0009 RCD-2024]
MGRARNSAVVVKQLLGNLRLPQCQRVHREAFVAAPSITSATLARKTAFEESQALLPSNTCFSRPEAISAQGSHLYQNHLVSCFSTQGQLTRRKGPDISLLDSALQKDWDHARNAHLGNSVIKPHTNRVVWWCCDKCPDGHLHSWAATVNSRSNGNDCPQCSGHKVCKHNSLATKAPDVAAEWDHEVNIGTPDTVVARSNQVCGWRCIAFGHKWRAAPGARVGKQTSSGCPMCALFKKRTKHPSFAECNHPLLAEWDHKRNAARGKRPDNVRLKSNKQIFWLCTKCPAGQVHSWPAKPSDRLGHSRTGCPFCVGKAACKCNSLQALYPDVAAEWDHSKNNGQLSEYAARSNQCAWWFSPRRGSWQQRIRSRTKSKRRRTIELKSSKALQAARQDLLLDSKDTPGVVAEQLV